MQLGSTPSTTHIPLYFPLLAQEGVFATCSSSAPYSPFYPSATWISRTVPSVYIFLFQKNWHGGWSNFH